MAMTKPYDPDLTYAYNYNLEIFDSDGDDVMMRLWFLDSGDRDCLGVEGNDCIHPD